MRTVTTPYADPHIQHLAEWTAKMLDASEATADKIGCSPAAIVAQAALETGWGAAAIGNNVFGIKADVGWKGARQLAHTWEHLDGVDIPMDCWFRDYPTLADGVADHMNFLMNNSRYANVFDKNNSMSDEEYLTRMARDGYATAPDYAASLIGVLQTVRSIETHLSENGVTPSPPAPRLMLIGSNGGDVAELQTKLHAAGFYAGSIDGDFGPMTKAAVIRFQTARNLVADGIVGQDTRSALT